MEQETLRAAQRETRGSRPASRLRREGFVPAIVYGRGLDPMPISITGRDLYTVLHTEAGLNAVISLEVDGSEPVLTVAREIQRDPVRGNITHLDFIKVSLDVAIEAEVALEFNGTPHGVREGGGFVETLETTVTVSALPMSVPTSIEVDISHLGVGDTLKVSDLPAIEGVDYVTEPEHPLATVVLPSVAEEIEEEVEEGEELLEEGEAATEGEVPGHGGEAAAEEESGEG